MKVGGSGRVHSSGVRGSGGKKAASGFKVDSAGPSQGASGPGRTGQVADVGALLALQGAGAVEDATTGRRRAVKRATTLLDHLEDIRLALLAGDVPVARLRGLMAALRNQKQAVEDPALSQLIEDIELRAEVELAKYKSCL